MKLGTIIAAGVLVLVTAAAAQAASLFTPPAGAAAGELLSCVVSNITDNSVDTVLSAFGPLIRKTPSARQKKRCGRLEYVGFRWLTAQSGS